MGYISRVLPIETGHASDGKMAERFLRCRILLVDASANANVLPLTHDRIA